MNKNEYFSALGKKSWEARKKTLTAEDRQKLAKKGKKVFKKKYQK